MSQPRCPGTDHKEARDEEESEDRHLPLLQPAPQQESYAYLKPKRKLRSESDVHCQTTIDGYCLYSDEELLEALRQDDRFVVEANEYGRVGIRARRKRDGKAGRRMSTGAAAR